ncbi:hypothetical protein Sste5346_000847 [Sporothrix stenoceras]|uniref:Major facilitator superfamily (MFS) profile domain-containing protein n=1 Tax=Sporothrix stenoceras TaxID=5173 RepID=A0ABR3ZQF0_9PEZI
MDIAAFAENVESGDAKSISKIENAPVDEGRGEIVEDDLKAAPIQIERQTGVDACYAEKAHLVSHAMTNIGMNWWQYEVWILCGFGWIVDNIAGYGLTVTYTPVGNEFVISNVTLTGISYSIGAVVGAFFWGPMADIIGRYWAFNSTLFLVGIFLIAAGGSNDIYTYGGMFAMVGFASGGNVPVASVVYLEFVPTSGHYLLTMLSAFWALGALADALIGWAFISKYSCDLTVSDLCLKADNMGWRYTLFTLGALVLVLAAVRFFVFDFPESPYYLLAQGRDEEAVKVVEIIAKRSKRPFTLQLDDFNEINRRYGRDEHSASVKRSFKEIFFLQFQSLHWSNLKPLFGTGKLALQSAIIMWIWASIGVAYPLYSYFLPVYLQARFSAIDPTYTLASTYQQYCYIAACTVPGPVLAGLLVETRLGRRYTMAIGTVISGVFLCISVVAARTNEAVVAWNCVSTLVINFMFAIQYAYTPESYPSTIRATVNGLCATIGYACGIAAPVISSQSGTTTSIPIWISAGLFLFTGLVMFALPYDVHKEGI